MSSALLVFALSSWPVIAGAPPVKSPAIQVELKSGSGEEKRTKQQLERLLAAHDTSKWTFTRKVVVDGSPDATPHSHPVLTLHTRHLKDDDLLLSTFIHEQLHWYLTAHQTEAALAIKDLKVLFPLLPVGFPDGAQDKESNYDHLIINALEYRSLQELHGELRARQIVDFWSGDHYTALYTIVLTRYREIIRVLTTHKLIPGGAG